MASVEKLDNGKAQDGHPPPVAQDAVANSSFSSAADDEFDQEPPASDPTLSELLSAGMPKDDQGNAFVPDKEVMRRIARDFADRALCIERSFQDDPAAACELYEQVRQLPSPRTLQQLRAVAGFTSMGPSRNASTKILRGIDAEGQGQVIKLLRAGYETEAHEEMAASLQHIDLEPHLVPFQLFARRSGALLAIMPEFMCTAAEMPLHGLNVPLSRMIQDVSVALETLHAQGFSHMDCKPSNIFSSAGRFYLADFGCVTQFRSRQLATTPQFLPVDLDQHDAAQARIRHRRRTDRGWMADEVHDWWMFAVTIAHKFFELPMGAGSPRAPPCKEVLALLQQKQEDNTHLRALCEKLTTLLPKPAPRLLPVTFAADGRAPELLCMNDAPDSPFLPYVPRRARQNAGLEQSAAVAPAAEASAHGGSGPAKMAETPQSA